MLRSRCAQLEPLLRGALMVTVLEEGVAYLAYNQLRQLSIKELLRTVT